MTSSPTPRRPRRLAPWFWGIGVGIVGALVMVLASGFMVETTNTDTFCASCHIMKPFRSSWQESVHGGSNPQGFTAQCVDCHLPHGNFVEYLTTKAITGTGDVIQNFYVDGAEFPWIEHANEHRTEFTFDSACRKCHANLTPKEISSGGRMAHRDYLAKRTDNNCTSCHPHVGHRLMKEHMDNFFHNPDKTVTH